MSATIAVLVAFLIGIGVGFKYQDQVEIKYNKVKEKVKEYVSKL